MGVAPSLRNVAGYDELIRLMNQNSASARVITVSNTTGSTIAKGSVVYVSGAASSVPSIAKARANAVTTMPGFAVIPLDIPNNTTGFCQFSGLIENLDTSAFAAGNLLYVSGATAGVLTATSPVHPNLSQLVAVVTRQDAVSGSMLVFPCFTPHGQEVGTISDSFSIGAATVGAKILKFVNAFIGQLSWTPTAARTLTLPDATDTLIGKATTDILTNKTFNSSGSGNVLQINGVTVPAPGSLSGTSNAPPGGVGTAAGGWDTAINRDAAIAAINTNASAISAIQTILSNAGLGV